MGNSNNPISSTVPSTVVLEGTAELICGLCIECTECSFRTWRNIHDIYCLVDHVVVAGRKKVLFVLRIMMVLGESLSLDLDFLQGLVVEFPCTTRISYSLLDGRYG